MGPLLFRNDLHQIELNLNGIVVFCQSDPLAHPADVGIDYDPRDSKGISEKDIGCLSSHTRECHQGLQRFRNLSSKSVHQLLARPLD